MPLHLRSTCDCLPTKRSGLLLGISTWESQEYISLANMIHIWTEYEFSCKNFHVELSMNQNSLALKLCWLCRLSEDAPRGGRCLSSFMIRLWFRLISYDKFCMLKFVLKFKTIWLKSFDSKKVKAKLKTGKWSTKINNQAIVCAKTYEVRFTSLRMQSTGLNPAEGELEDELKDELED